MQERNFAEEPRVGDVVTHSGVATQWRIKEITPEGQIMTVVEEICTNNFVKDDHLSDISWMKWCTRVGAFLISATDKPRDVADYPQHGDLLESKDFDHFIYVTKVNDGLVDFERLSKSGHIVQSKDYLNMVDWRLFCAQHALHFVPIGKDQPRDIATDPRVGDVVTSDGRWHTEVTNVDPENVSVKQLDTIDRVTRTLTVTRNRWEQDYRQSKVHLVEERLRVALNPRPGDIIKSVRWQFPRLVTRVTDKTVCFDAILQDGTRSSDFMTIQSWSEVCSSLNTQFSDNISDMTKEEKKPEEKKQENKPVLIKCGHCKEEIDQDGANDFRDWKLCNLCYWAAKKQAEKENVDLSFSGKTGITTPSSYMDKVDHHSGRYTLERKRPDTSFFVGSNLDPEDY